MLARFQVAYAERCDDAAFSPPLAKFTRKLYLGSLTLQREVARQLVALQAGVPCEQVFMALRAVDFPQPAAFAPPPRDIIIEYVPPAQTN